MAQFVITTGFVEIDGQDLTTDVKSYSVDLRKDQIDDTALNDTAHSFLAGLQNNEVTVEFLQDFAVSTGVDTTLFDVWDGGVAVTIKVRPTSGAITTSNPEYQFSGVLFDYTPISGAIGDQALTSVTFNCTTNATRQTT